MTIYEVGAPWPHPLRPGMQATIDPGDESPSMMLICALPEPTLAEIAALTKGRVRLAVIPAAPLVWIVLDAGAVSFDAPYALGLHSAERRAEIVVSAGRAADWSEEMHNLVTIATVDSASGVTRGLRAVGLSRAWWMALADGLARSAEPLDAGTHQAAIARDLARWPQTVDMLRDATAVETIGGA